MYEIVGQDSTLNEAASYNFERPTERPIKTEVVNGSENANDFDSLLDKLVNMCQQPVSVSAVEHSLQSNSYFGALQSIFQTYKDGITLPYAAHEIPKLQDQSNSLDKSLTDCITTIVETEKNDDDLSSIQIEESITNAFESLPKDIEFLNKEINKASSTMKSVLGRQCRIRPISNVDLDNVEKCFQLQKFHWANQIKNNICNASMVATSYFIKKQRRRNFPKKATRVLNEYFESHMKHPYPDEPTKLRLAQACGVSVAQVSNWFGNKRIRFKKSLDRQNAKEKLRQCDDSP
ncbi:Pre B-cell leukemia transcription factor 1 [Aphelenchoides bicaudatus]|nr:Pre B-cell leukemia transcription factor 1 [Aphelenchoides bicaudatus]